MDAITTAAIVSGVGSLVNKVGEIVATEVVKETTKDAYRSFKDALRSVVGSRGEKAITRLEQQPTSAEAVSSVKELVEGLGEPSDASDRHLEATFRELRRLVELDEVARRAMDAAAIRLDVEAGGDVNVKGIRGASTIDMKSRSAGDFNFGDVEMKGGSSGGN